MRRAVGYIYLQLLVEVVRGSNPNVDFFFLFPPNNVFIKKLNV